MPRKWFCPMANLPPTGYLLYFRTMDCTRAHEGDYLAGSTCLRLCPVTTAMSASRAGEPVQ